jgi:hypothetical protein
MDPAAEKLMMENLNKNAIDAVSDRIIWYTERYQNHQLMDGFLCGFNLCRRNILPPLISRTDAVS